MKQGMTALIASVLTAIGLTIPISSFAQAMQDRGWYAGGNIGQSRVKIDEDSLAVTGATASSLTKDETDTGWKLFAGYRFHPNFAVEGGWIDFGKFKASRSVTAPVVGSANAEIKVSGWNIDAVGIWPLQNQFSLFGRLGFIRSETKLSASTTGALVLTSGANAKKDEWNLKWGLGASYDINRTVAVRAEYEQAQKVGDKNSTSEGDVGLLSIGVVFKF